MFSARRAASAAAGDAAVLSREDPRKRRESLERWAVAHYGAAAVVENVAPMPGHAGISFGFDVVTGDHRDPLVVRVPPHGVRRRGNADVLRQVPLLRAVKAEGVPVPMVRWWSNEEEWFGAPFVMVERLPGRSLDRWQPGAPAGVDAADVWRVFQQALNALVAIHDVPWERYLSGWTTPRSLTAEIDSWRPTLDKADDPRWAQQALTLRSMLLDRLPPEPAPGLVHGDFYSNNWVVDGDRLLAVVDWEIAGIGPSLLDVGWLCMMHDRESWGPTPSGLVELAPGPSEIAAMYEAAAGRAISDLAWYRALAAWRLGAITVLNVRLHRSGRRRDPTWEILAEAYPYLIGRACQLLATTA